MTFLVKKVYEQTKRCSMCGSEKELQEITYTYGEKAKYCDNCHTTFKFITFTKEKLQ